MALIDIVPFPNRTPFFVAQRRFLNFVEPLETTNSTFSAGTSENHNLRSISGVAIYFVPKSRHLMFSMVILRMLNGT